MLTLQPLQHKPRRSSLPVRGSQVVLFVVSLVLVATTANAQTFNVLHTFTDGEDGAAPWNGLAIDRSGSLYGTSFNVTFKLKNSGAGWVLSPLQLLSSRGGLVTIGPNGSLYAPTPQGGLGCSGAGCGTIVNLQPQPTVCESIRCDWNVKTLYQFTGGADGYYPNSPLLFDTAGRIYGTSDSCVFALTPSGNGYSFSVIQHLTSSSGVILDSAGNLYGTSLGGSNGNGYVYKLTRGGSGWNEDVLYSFRGEEDGRAPKGGLIFDPAGNLYGTTNAGGSQIGGTVFELSPSANGWTYKLLYSFTFGNLNGLGGPTAALALDAAGNLYGTTSSEGAYGYGSVFKLTPGTNGWIYTSLHDFTGGTDGWMLVSTVTPVFDANGNLYGTTSGGGTTDYGTVWEITP